MPASAQKNTIGIGDWQLHLPNNRAKAVADAGDKIYCATEDGFFYYDKTFNSLVSLSKTDGFHDVNISTIRFDSVTNTLLVAYENANIDLVKDGQIININDIFRKPMVGVKTINHIYFHNKTAYLSCSFGVVLLDLVKLEVKDTYGNLGANGSSLKVYATTILNDSIYLATSNGILNARISNRNLLDFNNWHNITKNMPGTQPWDPYRTIASFNNKVYAGYDHGDVGAVFEYNGINWNKTTVPGFKGYTSMQPAASALMVTTADEVALLDKAGQATVIDDTLLQQPRSIIKTKGNVLWIADYVNGLIRYDGKTFQQLTPNGPASSTSFRIYPDKEGVLVLGGGYDEGYVPLYSSNSGFYKYANGEWQNFNSNVFSDRNQFPDVRFLVDVTRNPVNGKLYFASYGYGLIEWGGLGDFKIYNENTPGATLNSSIPNSPNNVRLTSVEADRNGNVWMINRTPEFANSPGLHVLRKDGSWQAYSMPGFANQNNMEHLLIDDNGYKWIVLANRPGVQGMLVFDDVNNVYKHLTINSDAGGLPSNVVYAAAKDRNGEVWLGTADGVAIFYNPSQVFSNNLRPASRPIIDGRYLLEGQQVKVIAVDGGNRKWIGTNNGVWLFNEDGDELIHHFTTKNSPLPSDKVQSLAINHQTGEV
ncbi:MAG: hypothetical protein LPJ89_10735, partial [Hymenobacteraceae bacterium]|nr:hypothetical protein [Hymenobacteraceae bacterium]